MTYFRILILIATVIMSIMLFTNTLFNNYQLGQAIWNLGHFLLFSTFIWLVLTHKKIITIKPLWMLLISIFLTFILGSLIEVAQYYTGRNMEFHDLQTDLLGGLFAYVTVALFYYKKNRILKYFLYSLLFSILILVLMPLVEVINDEIKMQQEFPVLSDFEDADKIYRWVEEDIYLMQQVRTRKVEGEYSLLVKYLSKGNPHISLKNFPSDWIDYNFLNFSVYNDQSYDVSIILKISDRLHKERGYIASDRYNKILLLKPGWNTYKIKLMEIEKAPLSRELNLHEVAEFSFYMEKSGVAISLNIDNIYLSIK